MRRFHFTSALAGGLVAALLVTALPAIAASVGDPFRLGQSNVLNGNATKLRGAVNSTNLEIRNTGSGVPLTLKNNSGGVPNGKPPLAVDSRRHVRNLNVDRVDFRHANELVRMAGAKSPEINEAVFVGGAADILTTTIEAPFPGFLVMGASVDASGATDDQYTCQIRVGGFIVAGSSRVSRVNWQGVDGPTDRTDNSQENCSTDATEVVAAGEHQVDFRVFGRNTAAFHSATLWVLWVPYGAFGDPPID